MAFGCFTDHAIDLSSGQQGLQVIYGPNEAGKSTALRAVQAALFGFPHRSKDNFLHRQPLVGAVLQHSSGDTISLLRRKGKKDTLLNPQTKAPFPADRLDPFLAGIDRETFRKIFGIDHSRLIEGGQELVALKGLVGESLFAAGLGGSGLATALSDLEAEAEELLARKKPSSKIRAARKEYDQAIAEKRQATVPFSKLKKLEKERGEVAAEKQAVVERLRDVRVETNRLERIRQSLGLLSQRRRWQAELVRLGEVHVLPAEYSAEERSRIQGQLSELKPRLQAMQERLDGANGLQQQLEHIVVRRDVLARESSIRDLQEQRGLCQQELQDEKDLTARQAETRSQIDMLLRDLSLSELGAAEDWDRLGTLRVTPECRAAVQSLSMDAKPSQQLPLDLAAQQEELQQELAGFQQELDRLGEPPAVADLSRLCQQIRKRGDLEDELENLQSKWNLAATQAEHESACLTLWKGSSDQLLSTAFPLPETIEDCEHKFATNEQSTSQWQTELNQSSTELRTIEEDLLALQKSGQTPTEEDLLTVREKRDQFWRSIRSEWLGDAGSADAGSAMKGSAAESTVDDALRMRALRMKALRMRALRMMAQRMRRHNSTCLPYARLLKCRPRTRLAVARVEQVSTKSSWWPPTKLVIVCDAKQNACKNKPNSWPDNRACSIGSPQLSKTEKHWRVAAANSRSNGTSSGRTAPWKRRARPARCEVGWGKSPLCKDHCERFTSYKPAASVVAQIAERRARISRSLKAAGEQVTPHSTLQQLLDQAEACVERREDEQRQGQRLRQEIVDLQARLAKLETRLAAANSARQRWESAWAVAMRQMGCRENALVDEAHAQLQQLDQLFQRLDELQSIDTQLENIRQRASQFAAEVQQLAQQLQFSCDEQSPGVVASQIQSLFEEARQQSAKHDRLVLEVEKDTQEVAATLEQERQLAARLQQLCHMAGAPLDEELAAVEQRSREYLQTTDNLRTVEDQLLELGDGRSIEAMQRESEGQDSDQLVVNIEALHQQAEELSAERETLAVRENQLAQAAELEPSAGTTHVSAAEADQRALGLLSRIQRDAKQYLQLRLAAVVLRQLIDRHRGERRSATVPRQRPFFATHL